jgi:hypothetical protein
MNPQQNCMRVFVSSLKQFLQTHFIKENMNCLLRLHLEECLSNCVKDWVWKTFKSVSNLVIDDNFDLLCSEIVKCEVVWSIIMYIMIESLAI